MNPENSGAVTAIVKDSVNQTEVPRNMQSFCLQHFGIIYLILGLAF